MHISAFYFWGQLYIVHNEGKTGAGMTAWDVISKVDKSNYASVFNIEERYKNKIRDMTNNRMLVRGPLAEQAMTANAIPALKRLFGNDPHYWVFNASR